VLKGAVSSNNSKKLGLVIDHLSYLNLGAKDIFLTTYIQNFSGRNGDGFVPLDISPDHICFISMEFEFRWPSASCAVQKPHTTNFH
jgi:hypothetical protein